MLPGASPALPPRSHLTALAGGVLGLVVVPAAAATTSTPLAVLAALTLCCTVAVLGGLVVEHARFLRRPRVPATAVTVLAPRPAAPRSVELVPGQVRRIGTPLGLARRTRLWIEPERVGVATWLHAHHSWPRSGEGAVEAAQIVTIKGDPVRFDLVDAAGAARASLGWPTWFPSSDRGPLVDACARAGLPVAEVVWTRRLREAWPPADGSQDLAASLAQRSATAFVLQAAALAVPGVLALASADGLPPALGMTWDMLGGLTIAAATTLATLALTVGWADRRDVR